MWNPFEKFDGRLGIVIGFVLAVIILRICASTWWLKWLFNLII